MGSGPNGEWLTTDEAFWRRVKLPIIGWKLWYADGSTRDSLSSTWTAAPRVGLQVLVVFHPEIRKTLVKGRDEYTLPGEAESKLGLMIERQLFEAIQFTAQTDKWEPEEASHANI